MFERLRSGHGLRLRRALSNGLTTVGVVAAVIDTSREIGAREHLVLLAIVVAVAVCFAAEFMLRLWRAEGRLERRAYLTCSDGVIDFAAAIALPLGWLLVSDPRDVTLFAVVWALRYIRHTTGLDLLWRILRRSRTALFSVAAIFIVIFLVAATLGYVFERDAQPETFGSVPRAMWWAIVTLTTTGYGDLVPTTLWGRFLASWLMIGGIVMFALQAGIIASAFAEELQRRHFLHTWDLVTTVPFFQELGAAAIADIVRLLQARDVAAGTVIMRRGEPGDAMYFIVSGEATVLLSPEPIQLGPGSFFGEMALLFGMPRSATVVATAPSVLLVLDIADFRELAGRRPELVNVIEAEGRRRRAANEAQEQERVRSNRPNA